MRRRLPTLPTLLLVLAATTGAAAPSSSVTAPPSTCAAGLGLRVLGSGGPELAGGRAASSYLLTLDGVARGLVDVGSGALLRFGESGARLADLDVLVLSHLHTDHAGDLAALLKALQFVGRQRPLDVVGPRDGAGFPSTPTFLQALVGPAGAFAYLRGHLDGTAGRVPLRVTVAPATKTTMTTTHGLTITTMAVPHGPVPALAVRVSHGGRHVVLGGDHNGDDAAFVAFAEDADVLVLHAAIPDDADVVAARLHATPEELGAIATRARAKRLVLSHVMTRTAARLDDVVARVRAGYDGPVVVARDLDCLGD
jgi:ribonuclease BN (tRNA processing enzyme)